MGTIGANFKQCAPAKKVSVRSRQDDRKILNGILWIYRTGAPWKDLPGSYPPYQTCHRRFQEWVRQGVWTKVLTKLALDLKQRGNITPQNVVSTLAGTGEAGSADGNIMSAQFSKPSGIAMDAAGNIYVSEMGGSRIRKIVAE